jgi:VanZ family protein
MGLCFALSSIAGDSFPKSQIWSYDKVLHMLEYGAGGALAALALGGRRPGQVALAVVLVSLYGVTDELHQLFVPGRSCDVKDWIADTIGATLGSVGMYVLLRVWKRSPRRGQHQNMERS